MFKIAGQVFILFPPQFQALVLHCALTGWFKHIAGATSRAFPPRDNFPLIKVVDSRCSMFGEEEDSHLLRKDFENAEDALQRLTL